jgi:uncharacterized protein YggE
MSYLFLLLSFLFIGQTQTRSKPPHELSLTVKSSVQIPADQIVFSINVNAEGDTPQAAFKLHKKREKALVNLLDKYNIKDKNIKYQPVSISKRRQKVSGNTYDTTYVTRQQVSLIFTDFDVFTKIQIGLIQHNFDDFSTHFTSSKIEEGKDKALKKAIKKARHKAELIVGQTDVDLGSIIKINYHQGGGVSPRPISYMKAAKISSESMLKYKRTLEVSAIISIDYALRNES